MNVEIETKEDQIKREINREEKTTALILRSEIGISTNKESIKDIEKKRKVKSNNLNLNIEAEPDYKVYKFQDSGIGESWLIGTDIYNGSPTQCANAFKKGISACTEVLEIPGILTDSNGKSKAVEIIGRGAFCNCGCHKNCASNGKTKQLKIPKQVKVIKYYGLAGMYDLEVFEIEAGSVLEKVEDRGLTYIGYYTGQSSSKRTATLILPSTLSTVFDDGIWYCNLFTTIIYCGTHLLSNSSTLDDISPETVLKVTSQYPSGQKIFGRSPNRSSQNEADAQSECKLMGFLPRPSLTPIPPPAPTPLFHCSPLNYISKPLLTLAATLLPSDSLLSPSLKTFSPSLSFFLPFT